MADFRLIRQYEYTAYKNEWLFIVRANNVRPFSALLNYHTLIRILSITLFSVFTVTLSSFFKRTIPVLATAIGTTLLPALFDSLGISILRKVNYIELLRATPSLISHTAPITFGVFLLMTLILAISAGRAWLR